MIETMRLSAMVPGQGWHLICSNLRSAIKGAISMKFPPLVVLALISAVAIPAAADSTFTWDFATSTPNQSVGSNSATFTTNGLSISATGSINLYYKNQIGRAHV